jgi:hypothetical protein
MQASGEPFDTTFELSDTLFAKAEIEQVDEVYIWLGVRLSLSPPLTLLMRTDRQIRCSLTHFLRLMSY